MSNPFRDGGAPSGSSLTVEQLRQKELELDRREQQVEYQKRKVEELKAVSPAERPPNWPPCRPLIYQNIREEIPEKGRQLVTRVYFSWFLLVAALVLNFGALLGGIAAPIPADTTGPNFGVDFGISIVMLVVLPPIAFVFWHRTFYVAVKRDRSTSYFFFFFNYSCHILLSIMLAIGIPQSGGGGFINAFRVIKNSPAAGIVLLVSAGLWCFVVLFSLWQLQAAIRYYRSQGHTARDDASKMATEALSTPQGQAAAVSVGVAALAATASTVGP